MRIERLRINQFRGIPELEVEPNNDNLCLVGPNGSGKSSVIEAIDFLLTGKIQDLRGEGSGGISIREHVPYLRASPDDCWVEGTFSSNGESVTIKRRLTDRNELEHEGDLPESIKNLLESAEKGQHYLSRHEILQFIVARQQSRSEQLRTLLDLRTIKKRRLELQGAADNLEERASRLEREVNSARTQLLGIFDDVEGEDELLDKINEYRAELDGEPLEELHSETPFREGLNSPSERASASPLQSNQTKELLEEILRWFDENADEFWQEYEDIISDVEEIRESEDALRDHEVLDLVQRGKEFIDEETTQCPLCLTPWEQTELEELLEQREQNAEETNQIRDRINESRNSALDLLTNVRTATGSLMEILDQHEEFETEILSSFRDRLEEFESGLEGDLIDEVPFEDYNEETRRTELEPEEIHPQVEDLRSRGEELPNLDRLEEIWDDLHQSHQMYGEWQTVGDDADATREVANEVEAVKDEFLAARDEVLTETYAAISDRFEEFYTTLHHDESDFSPVIEPTETGLDIQVDFHGEGHHPPQALHSEGHQDSMGICLFLALCDYIEGNDLSVIMLDDVVMSIDASHRRALAELLEAEVSNNFQLLITTHDELWYRHLKTEGVISSQNTVKFTSWSIGDGPVRVDRLADGWSRIDDLLDEGDVQGAAHRLRHTAEWFVREACHQLNAEVQFKADGRWMLGDFMGPALSRYKELIKNSKAAEDSWGNDVSDINDLDERRSEVYERLNMEQGVVNPNVHFNENVWATTSPEELRDVVDAFRNLYDLFWCGNCGACVSVLEEDYEEVQLRCSCGQKANWTLEES